MRRTGQSIRLLISDADAKTPPVEGWVVNRSSTGLRIAVHHPIPAETILSICVAEPVSKVWVQVRVKNCCEGDAIATVGCQFLTPPTLELLATFG